MARSANGARAAGQNGRSDEAKVGVTMPVILPGGRAVAAAAAVVVLLSGCARFVDGVGSYATGRSNVPDAKVEIRGSNGSRIDKIAGNAITDIQTFWTQQMPQVFGKPYKPVSAFYSVDPQGRRAAPCTDSAADIRGNAFYCPTQDIIAWDRRLLFPDLAKRFGDFLVAMVLAHEWGHVIQHRSSLPSNRTIVLETQADCYAGSWTASALHGGAPHFQIGRQDLDSALAGYLLFRDPVGAQANDRQAHGSGFDRISAFQEGFDRGPKHCTTFSDRRLFTEIPFNNLRDQAQQGNLPYADTIGQGPADVENYWSTTFEKAYGKKWEPAPKVTAFDGDRDRPSCDSKKVSGVEYCPTGDTIFFDRRDALKRVYDQTGDFGPMSLIAVAFGQAARKRLGESVNGEPALLGSICLAGAYAGDVFNRRRDKAIILSPGDLDEAIQALLNFAGRTGFFEANGTAGFDRVAAFRKGFADIRSCG
jgi:predicted metalloprotease